MGFLRATNRDDDWRHAAMQLIAPPGDLDGIQRHDLGVVAGNEGIFGLGNRSEAAAMRIIA